jgi:hypothetical protein
VTTCIPARRPPLAGRGHSQTRTRAWYGPSPFAQIRERPPRAFPIRAFLKIQAGNREPGTDRAWGVAQSRLVSLLITGTKTSGHLLRCEWGGLLQRRVPGLGPFRTQTLTRSRFRAGKSPRPSKTPGTVFRPGAVRQFQFPESTDLPCRVKCVVARMERSEMRERRSRIAALRPTINHSLKVMMPIGAVVAAGAHAAGLEIFVRSRRGTGRCDRASRSARHRRGRIAGRA